MIWRREGFVCPAGMPIPAVYGPVRIGIGFREDQIVEDVESESVEAVVPVRNRQFLT